MRINIVKRSHSFEVKTNYRNLAYWINKFAERYEEWEWKRIKGQRATRVLIKSYVIKNDLGSRFIFHLHGFDEFISYLNCLGIGKELYTITEEEPYKPKKIKFKVVSPYDPMPEQVPLISYLVDRNSRTKILTLQTGMGKTYCWLRAIGEIGERFAICIPAKYVERWMKDLTGDGRILDLEESDVWVVKGSADFARLIQAAKNKEFKSKGLVFSSTTFQNYLKAFADDEIAAMREYGCHPKDLMRLLEVGVFGRDEVHEFFHFNFLVDLNISVPKTISLSATIDFDNQMTNKMCSLMFPKNLQVNNGEWHKYINAIGLYWSLNDPKRINYKLNGTYNHGAFETSIMKNKYLLGSYLDMIEEMVEEIYARGSGNGNGDDKIIIFAYTVKMCTYLSDRLEGLYDDTEIIVNRYVGEDEYTDLMEGDVIVSTLKSAGTAVDIPKLRFVLMTTCIYSTQSNVQALGRLRKLKHKKDVHPEFYYLICRDIDKHIEYHKHKEKIFYGKVLNHTTSETSYRV